MKDVFSGRLGGRALPGLGTLSLLLSRLITGRGSSLKALGTVVLPPSWETLRTRGLEWDGAWQGSSVELCYLLRMGSSPRKTSREWVKRSLTVSCLGTHWFCKLQLRKVDARVELCTVNGGRRSSILKAANLQGVCRRRAVGRFANPGLNTRIAEGPLFMLP